MTDPSKTKPTIPMHSLRKKLNAKPEVAAFCNACVIMTSTPTGWEALTSQNGFKHHNRHELVCCAVWLPSVLLDISTVFCGVWKYGVQDTYTYLRSLAFSDLYQDRYDVAGAKPRDADSIPAHFENCISALKATLEFDPPMVNQVEELYSNT